MDFTDSSVKKITQVSEQRSTPIQVPIMLGGECYIVTQQDVRRIEDTRYVTYYKLLSDGRLVPANSAPDNGCESNVSDAFLFACKCLQGIQNNAPAKTEDVDMNEEPTAVAKLAAQMDASAPCQSAAAMPLTVPCIKAASHVHFEDDNDSDSATRKCCCCCCCGCGCGCNKRISSVDEKAYCSRGCNTVNNNECKEESKCSKGCNTTEEETEDSDNILTERKLKKRQQLQRTQISKTFWHLRK